MTLGNAAAATRALIVWCKACQHQVEADPPEMAERYGSETKGLGRFAQKQEVGEPKPPALETRSASAISAIPISSRSAEPFYEPSEPVLTR